MARLSISMMGIADRRLNSSQSAGRCSSCRHGLLADCFHKRCAERPGSTAEANTGARHSTPRLLRGRQIDSLRRLWQIAEWNSEIQRTTSCWEDSAGGRSRWSDVPKILEKLKEKESQQWQTTTQIGAGTCSMTSPKASEKNMRNSEINRMSDISTTGSVMPQISNDAPTNVVGSRAFDRRSRARRRNPRDSLTPCAPSFSR